MNSKRFSFNIVPSKEKFPVKRMSAVKVEQKQDKNAQIVILTRTIDLEMVHETHS
jgi:hypothetical protein